MRSAIPPDEAQRDADPDSGPERPHLAAAAVAHEEGGDDPDDEGGLEAFSQSDDERGKHPADSGAVSSG